MGTDSLAVTTQSGQGWDGGTQSGQLPQPGGQGVLLKRRITAMNKTAQTQLPWNSVSLGSKDSLPIAHVITKWDKFSGGNEPERSSEEVTAKKGGK